MDNIGEANEWLIGVLQNHEDEKVFDAESNFTRGGVAEASGVGTSIYGLRGSTSSSSSHRRRKVVMILCLIDEKRRRNIMMMTMMDLDTLIILQRNRMLINLCFSFYSNCPMENFVLANFQFLN